MFIFKANPLMYIFILLAFLFWIKELCAPIGYVKTEKETSYIPNFFLYFKLTFMFAIFVFIHIFLSLLMAPIAQGIFTIYLAYVFSGGWEFIKEKATVIAKFEIADSEVHQKLVERFEILPEVRWLDKFLHDYLLKNNSLMFSFLLIIFFFIKMILSHFGLQIYGLKWFFTAVNLIGLIVFSYIYSKSSPGDPNYNMEETQAPLSQTL